MTENPTSDTDPDSPPRAARGTALLVARILGVITLAAIAVQFMFAGLGAFGESFDLHRMLGNIIGALTLGLLIVMLIARPSRSAVVMSVLLVVLAAAGQPVLGQLGDGTDAWYGAIHALNGLAILGLTARLTALARPEPTPPERIASDVAAT